MRHERVPLRAEAKTAEVGGGKPGYGNYQRLMSDGCALFARMQTLLLSPFFYVHCLIMKIFVLQGMYFVEYFVISGGRWKLNFKINKNIKLYPMKKAVTCITMH